MIRVGIVAEGKSEWWVFEEVMRALHPNIEVLRIRLDQTQSARAPNGWRGVRAWCEEYGPSLAQFMVAVPERPLHLLIVHADCSMAHNAGIVNPCPPAYQTAEALRHHVIGTWLGLAAEPAYVIVANPSLSTDAWVVAALEPPYIHLNNVECRANVENELVARHLLRNKNGAVQKSEARYLPLARSVAGRLVDVRTRCSQADYFCVQFLNRIPMVQP